MLRKLFITVAVVLLVAGIKYFRSSDNDVNIVDEHIHDKSQEEHIHYEPKIHDDHIHDENEVHDNHEEPA